MVHDLINFIVNMINEIGYLGIFIGMFLESTLIPIPSELVMIPAGIASAKGIMNIYLVTIVGTLGNILGAVFSYYLALTLGRKIILKIGKYFFIKTETIVKIEVFFKKYGSASVFIGRLLPGFRHFISLPAGLAKMDFKLFLFYTSLGATIWTSILAFTGYFIGENQDLIVKNIKEISLVILIFSIFAVSIIFAYKKIR
ncbi:MAG: DedA family protein [Proteobacteria bacterium]|nr:DedA family protein [Pseudomonadota bacterium]NCA27859.1 DedA family protein [Pseudomonadota bacterium]